MHINPDGNKPLVWVVDSAYTGELRARMGLAERLGQGYSVIPLPTGNLNDYQKLLAYEYGKQSGGHPRHLLIISGTGEETTAEIADLRTVFAERLINVYVASILPDEPHPRLGEYDLIASPQLTGKNVVTMPGVPHLLTRATLDAAFKQHEVYFQALPKPIIGFLLGGNTRYCSGFTAAHARNLGSRINKLCVNLGGSLIIFNSRRTPEAAIAPLREQFVNQSHLFFDWHFTEHSVYLALLAHADLLIVTGDSLSMCSEAAFTGKPVLVDLSENATEHYHREIVGQLIKHGAAKHLTDLFQPWTYTPPDPTGTVADTIRKKFNHIFEGLSV